jgi:hypothetical protein
MATWPESVRKAQVTLSVIVAAGLTPASATAKLGPRGSRGRAVNLSSATGRVEVGDVENLDDGKTCQTLRVWHRRGGWVTAVHDAASGYVSQRSTVVAANGDSTVQTIYRAFGIG